VNGGGAEPTRTSRYLVVGSLFVLSLITYIDRAAISTAKGPMAKDLSLSDGEMGLVFSLFALGTRPRRFRRAGSRIDTGRASRSRRSSSPGVC
jgi:hypothetical protein